MPKIIPKIIHQVWIKGDPPPIKAYISKQARLMYPDYEYKLWKKENLTA
jgi:mannosyltransferase OCH1-like enzyme